MGVKQVACTPYVKRMRLAAPPLCWILWTLSKSQNSELSQTMVFYSSVHRLLLLFLIVPLPSTAQYEVTIEGKAYQLILARDLVAAIQQAAADTALEYNRIVVQGPLELTGDTLRAALAFEDVRFASPVVLETRRFSTTDALCSHPLPTGDLPARNSLRKWIFLPRLPHSGQGQLQTDFACRQSRFFGHPVFRHGLFSADQL